MQTGDEDLLVAVIDTGFRYDHEDLHANSWVNPIECPDGPPLCEVDTVDDDDNGYADDFYGWNFGNPPTNNPLETVSGYHGTHVAGIIGAVGNNNTGVVGVNWNVKLVALKYGEGPGFVSSILAAIDYCVANNIKVSNNSYIGGGFSANECNAIQAAGDQIGHIFVAAAGNAGIDLDSNPQYPASCQVTNIITVAASDQNDHWACLRFNACPPTCPATCITYSNYGPDSVHIAAPGVSITSTTWDTTPPYDYYSPDSGTSMATPFVTGAVALIWAQHPTWDYSQVREHLLNTAHKGLVNGKVIDGRRLDIGAALVDCNNNDVVDGLDVYNHTSDDCNANNIPDECDAPGAFGACCLTGVCTEHYKDYGCAAAGGNFLGIGTTCGCEPGCDIFRPGP